MFLLADPPESFLTAFQTMLPASTKLPHFGPAGTLEEGLETLDFYLMHLAMVFTSRFNAVNNYSVSIPRCITEPIVSNVCL